MPHNYTQVAQFFEQIAACRDKLRGEKQMQDMSSDAGQGNRDGSEKIVVTVVKPGLVKHS